MTTVTQTQIAAAQAVFEHWLCEVVGVDITAPQSESIVRQMIVAAMLADKQLGIKIVEDASMPPNRIDVVQGDKRTVFWFNDLAG